MSEIVPTVGAVVINVNDIEAEKAFWSALLGVGVAREFPGFFVWLEPQHEGGISVARNRQHMADIGRRGGERRAQITARKGINQEQA